MSLYGGEQLSFMQANLGRAYVSLTKSSMFLQFTKTVVTE